jgi:hypothetical protein
MFRKIVTSKISNEKHMSQFKTRKLNITPPNLLLQKTNIICQFTVPQTPFHSIHRPLKFFGSPVYTYIFYTVVLQQGYYK